MTLFLFLQESSSVNWSLVFNIGMGIFGFVCLVGAAVIVLLSKRKEDIHATETKRADSNEKLIKTRDQEILDLDKEKERVEKELESVTAEYRTLIGIDLKVLFDFWARYEEHLAHVAELERQIRVLNKRLEGKE
jgi:hypothetical protein